jgi:hypothetical protein
MLSDIRKFSIFYCYFAVVIEKWLAISKQFLLHFVDQPYSANTSKVLRKIPIAYGAMLRKPVWG